MNELEIERLEDFKKVLTYHLVSKIQYSFKGNYKLYFEAPKLWNLWRQHKMKYDNKIYQLIIKFNSTSLTSRQVQHIFGKDKNMKYLNYSSILENDSSIKTFEKGTICMQGRRFQLCKRYSLDYNFIAGIFNDPELMKKVLDAGSDYYTSRQRRLIFTQINKQKNYHYKTHEEVNEETEIKKMIDEIDIDL